MAVYPRSVGVLPGVPPHAYSSPVVSLSARRLFWLPMTLVHPVPLALHHHLPGSDVLLLPQVLPLRVAFTDARLAIGVDTDGSARVSFSASTRGACRLECQLPPFLAKTEEFEVGCVRSPV